MELECKVQHYEWGKIGMRSAVSKLISSANPCIMIHTGRPYAELWMGTHPNGPSLIIDRAQLLSEYLEENHDAIGPEVKKKFGDMLPFLLKVLSIRKALSIQAHPEKHHAEQLHKSFPQIYKDPNHKPELTIAITKFEALCGFRPVSQIQDFLKELPELTLILPKDILNAFLSVEQAGDGQMELKQIFHALMTSDEDFIMVSLQNLLMRLENEGPEKKAFLLYPLIEKLHDDFPGDVGCWAPYFMNYIKLQPGQAIYLKPNLPHAYLRGDCIECMACSDNVVRAGLTLKLIDVPTLIEMLDYTSYSLQDMLFTPHFEDQNSCIWRPPVPDFAVVKIRVESGEYNTIARPSPSIIIVISGEAQVCDTEVIEARPGVIIFLKASRQMTIKPSRFSHLEAYQAICNV